jgi:antibiotic biosynthesis monooxygenase (ABM) superfamily enzyme
LYIRCAFFEGRVKPGQETAFTSFIQTRLMPLWTRFPGAEEVRVLRQQQADVDEPYYEMVLAIRYPSLEAVELALKSDVRRKSREETNDLMKMF